MTVSLSYWVHKLNESNSRLHKEDVLKQALEFATIGDYGSEAFLGLLVACYNPFVRFNIKQVENTFGLTNRENPWSDFNHLLNLLSENLISGNVAREACAVMSLRFDSDEWNNVCVPVIKKDIRCGISEKTINKVCKKTKYVVPTFECQLATSCEDRPEMSGVKRIEPKLDGVRVLMFVQFDTLQSDMTVNSYSRNGIVFENFWHIEDEIRNNLSAMLTTMGPAMTTVYKMNGGFVLDGEVTGPNFQALMSQARRVHNPDCKNAVLNVFDIIPVADFMLGVYNASLNTRLSVLKSMGSVFNRMSTVRLLDSKQFNLSTEAGAEHFREYANECVLAGFEGVMIKDLDAPYVCNRNTFWLKWKPTITIDLEVVDFEEGTGKNAGRLGAVIFSGSDNGRDITVSVGSGWSDDDRDYIWANRSEFTGRIGEIIADAVSKNKNGTYSLRFPRMNRWRDVFTGEKE